LLIAVSIVLATTNPAYSQYIPCRIVHMDNRYADSVMAGEPLQVTSTLTVACDMYLYYTIKVDLMDEKSGAVSSATYSYYQDSASFVSPPLANQLNAPTQPGNWALKIQATIINQVNGQAAASTAQVFSIKILPYVPTTTTTQAVTTTSIASTLSSTEITASSSFSQMTTSTSSSQEAFTTQTTSSTSTENAGQIETSTYALAAIVVIAIAIISIVAMRRCGRGVAKEPKKRTARVGFCWNCGKQLRENWEFCGHCGTKQTRT